MSSEPPDRATIRTERIGAVCRITLDRPERHNPLTPRCIREVLGAVAEAEADPDMRAIIIRGSGRSFSSGYGILPEDIQPQDAQVQSGLEGDVSAMIALGTGWAKVWDCRIPVIAQVHGNCLAGGTDLALHCDIVVAAEDATIGFPPVRSMGVPPTNMWLYHLGPQWTKRLLFTGDTVNGTEAAAIGLVQAAVPPSDLDDYALALAARIALVGRELLAANKRVINEGVELMGRSQLQRFAAMNDAVAHRAPAARAFTARAGEVGLKQAVHERDTPFVEDRASPGD